MDELSTSPPPTVRDRTVLFLLFLTSEVCLESVKKHLPGDRVAFELSRVWVDEIYWPGPRYMDGIKGNLSPERVAEFAAQFSDDELKSLERFHAFFELRIDMLSERARNEGRFPESDMWKNIIRDATYLVEDLEPDAERRRALLEWLSRTLAQGEAGPLLSGGRLALTGPE